MFEIKNIMTIEVVTVKKDTPISEVIRTLVEKHITDLPVVDDNMKMVGIISEKHVLRLLNDAKYYVSATAEDFMTTY